MSSREKCIEPIWKSRVWGNEVRNTVCTIQPVQVSFLCHTKVLSGTLKVTFSSVKQMKYRLATNTQSLLSDPLQRAMSSDLLAGLVFFFFFRTSTWYEGTTRQNRHLRWTLKGKRGKGEDDRITAGSWIQSTLELTGTMIHVWQLLQHVHSIYSSG